MGMMNVRAESPELDGPATSSISALVALVRLIARHAAREWSERRLEADHQDSPIIPYGDES